MATNQILLGDCLETLKTVADCSVQTCVTSPPYYGLRDYGIEGQIGLEETPEAYVAKLVAVFREVRRALKDDGTVFLNLGDSYFGSTMTGGKGKSSQAWSTEHQDRETLEQSYHQITGMSETRPTDRKHESIKPKDLIGIPWMVAFALRADGWWLRSDIIWAKPNPMPESVTDRPTKSHEYIFLLAKSARYYYDNEAIKEEATGYGGRKDDQFKGAIKSYDGVMPGGKPQTFAQRGHKRWEYKNLQADGQQPNSMHLKRLVGEEYLSPVRNKRDVWTVTTKPYKEAHFATYPPDLIEPCILAGTSEKGECPKCGKAWTRVVERQNESNWEYRKSKGAIGGSMETGSKQQIGSGWSHDLPARENATLGWQPGCTCDGHFEDVPFVEDDPDRTWSKFFADQEVSNPVPQIVLDPFNGSGTTGAVAIKHGRNYIGCELKPDYIEMTKRRFEKIQTVLHLETNGN